MEYSKAANSSVVKSPQKGLSESAVPGTNDATVWNGHMEIKE
jgi:hypothetical protein